MAWMMEHAKNKIHAISVGVVGILLLIGRQPVTEQAWPARLHGAVSRATARDRAGFACEVAWLVVFRRRCAILGVPRQIHGVPHPMQRFSLFFPLSVVYFARFTPLISLISSNYAPKATLSSILMLQRCF